MGINIKLNIDTRRIRSRKVLFFVSVMFAAVLVSFCFVSIFSVSPFALGASNVVVSNEAELRNAVKSATEPIVIALNNDIVLTSSELTISADKDITLTSTNNSKFFKLLGINSDTIIVEKDGVLRLEGIIVTHTSGVYGRGVLVLGGTLIMYDGEIRDNTIAFVTDVTASVFGGGVFISGGSFSMFGGKISGNTVAGDGGGVHNYMGTFEMHGGVITNNTALGNGGGVYNVRGNFNLFGGAIYGNTAVKGGGVYSDTSGSFVWKGSIGSFNMSGGVVYGNTVTGANNKNADVCSITFSDSSAVVVDDFVSGGNDDGVLSDGMSGLDDTGELSSSSGFSLRNIAIICVGIVVVVGCCFVILRQRKKLQVTTKLRSHIDG